MEMKYEDEDEAERKLGVEAVRQQLDRLRGLVCAGLRYRVESSLSRGRVLGVALPFGYRLLDEETLRRRDGMESGAGGREAKRNEARRGTGVAPKYKVQQQRTMHAGAAPNYWVLTGARVEPASVYSSQQSAEMGG